MMTAQILNGKQLAQTIISDLKREVTSLKKSTGQVPCMMNVMVGDDHGSCAYARSQKRAAEAIGIDYQLVNLPGHISQEDFIEHIQKLNGDESVHGMMIHKPLPSHIDYQVVENILDIDKDMEGINVANVGRMLLGETKIIPCTPAAVMAHIESIGVDIRGKEVVIVGASEIVGKPLALLLLSEYATVTVCHIATSEAGKLEEHVSSADIVIVAVGKAELIPGEWIKEGAIVIDVGINKVKDRIVGDVAFDSASQRASFITPVPGGVGPVTVVMLMRNGIEAYKKQKGIKAEREGEDN